MKAVLLIDIPDDLTMEDLDVCGEISSNRIDDGWFRELRKEDLKPMPEKKPVSYHDDLLGDVEKNFNNIGWNDCIEEIEE